MFVAPDTHPKRFTQVIAHMEAIGARHWGTCSKLFAATVPINPKRYGFDISNSFSLVQAIDRTSESER